jgi:WD40 repeat protein
MESDLHGTDFTLNTGTLNLDSPASNVIDHRIVVVCERDHWVYHSDWSPDGSYLVFSYAPFGGNEAVGQKAPGSDICICDLKTGKWIKVTTDGNHNKEPDWVPVQVNR